MFLVLDVYMSCLVWPFDFLSKPLKAFVCLFSIISADKMKGGVKLVPVSHAGMVTENTGINFDINSYTHLSLEPNG